MKLSEAIENFVDAKHEYENVEDLEYVSNKENQNRRTTLRERYEEAKSDIDSFQIREQKNCQPVQESEPTGNPG